MSFKLGNTNISELYVGNSKIAQAYLGSTKVYEYVNPFPYRTVTIGSQTWTAENLAINDGQGGVQVQNYGVQYGLDYGTQYFYTIDAAIRIVNNIQGWHLPSKAEVDTLISAVGGSSNACKVLKTTLGWRNTNGTDAYGFSMIGAREGGRAQGDQSWFWTTTKNGSNYYVPQFNYNSNSLSYNTGWGGSWPVSIRLVKDA